MRKSPYLASQQVIIEWGFMLDPRSALTRRRGWAGLRSAWRILQVDRRLEQPDHQPGWSRPNRGISSGPLPLPPTRRGRGRPPARETALETATVQRRAGPSEERRPVVPNSSASSIAECRRAQLEPSFRLRHATPAPRTAAALGSAVETAHGEWSAGGSVATAPGIASRIIRAGPVCCRRKGPRQRNGGRVP